MFHIVGANSIHGSVQSNKSRDTTWARPKSSNVGTNVWVTKGGFLGGQNSIEVLMHPDNIRECPTLVPWALKI